MTSCFENTTEVLVAALCYLIFKFVQIWTAALVDPLGKTIDWLTMYKYSLKVINRTLRYFANIFH